MMVVVLVEPGDVLVKEERVVLAANGDPKRQSLIILVEVRAVLRWKFTNWRCPLWRNHCVWTIFIFPRFSCVLILIYLSLFLHCLKGSKIFSIMIRQLHCPKDTCIKYAYSWFDSWILSRTVVCTVCADRAGIFDPGKGMGNLCRPPAFPAIGWSFGEAPGDS